MVKKIAGILFLASFILCGCGINSIFDGHAFEWFFAFVVAVACAIVLSS